jgi:hypothetical protein
MYFKRGIQRIFVTLTLTLSLVIEGRGKFILEDCIL